MNFLLLTTMLCVSTGVWNWERLTNELALPAPLSISYLNNQFYGHGAFFGASGQLLMDTKWNTILKLLMPDVHEPITDQLAKGAGSKDILLQFENNPVAAAFGIMKTQEMDTNKVRISSS